MAFFDLPSFVVNRQTPRLDIWTAFRPRLMRAAGADEVVEEVSGLPRSLLDVFARLGEPGCEDRFWRWPGCEGRMSQVQMWEAYRYAGILKHREWFRTAANRMDLLFAVLL